MNINIKEPENFFSKNFILNDPDYYAAIVCICFEPRSREKRIETDLRLKEAMETIIGNTTLRHSGGILAGSQVFGR